MAEVINLAQKKQGRHIRRKADLDAPAKILMFTGVRYEGLEKDARGNAGKSSGRRPY